MIWATLGMTRPPRRTSMKRRRGGGIVVPQIVMHELLVPLQLPGERIERDERVAVEVVAVAVGAVEIGGRAAERHVHEPALDIDGHEAPGVRAGAVLVGARRPRLASRLTRPRDGVERPQHLAGARIPPADVAVQPARRRRAFAVGAAGDHDVAVDGRR